MTANRESPPGDLALDIVPLRDDADAEAAAALMSGSEPWITLGRDYASALRVMRQEGQEAYVVLDRNGAVVGLLLLMMQGALVGYIRSIALRPEWRSRGAGRALMAFAERRIHRESPNVFLLVSSFNPRARAFYERLGFTAIGELPDFMLRGHSECLMRKSLGPVVGFVPPEAAPEG